MTIGESKMSHYQLLTYIDGPESIRYLWRIV